MRTLLLPFADVLLIPIISDHAYSIIVPLHLLFPRSEILVQLIYKLDCNVGL